MRRLISSYPQNRAELLIATGRMILSAFFLLAIWLDPPEPHRYASLTYGLLSGYLVYSFLLGAAICRLDFIRNRQRLFSHAVDLMVFSVVMFLTEGPTSPFFVYFIFLLACATLRWQWRGTFVTAIISLAIVVILAFFPANLLHNQNFELNRFIIRVIYLAVVATLLGYMGKHEQSMRTMFARLAAWPHTPPTELQTLTRDILGYAADTLNAPRMLLLWEEEEEPWINMASWSRDGFQYSREHPDAFGTLVAGQLAGMSFLCQDTKNPQATVVHDPDSGMRTWVGAPLDPELQKRFSISAVLASRLDSENLSGYLLMLDKAMMTNDDLILCGIVAHEVESRLDHYYLLKQLQQAAASGERVRLARDLHDGVLQSLTGATLQLETVQRLIESDPEAARLRIKELQQQLSNEQMDLRTQIRELRPFIHESSTEDFSLAARLAELTERIRRQWGLTVEMPLPPRTPDISRSMAREVYFVIHEALINAVRHSGATFLKAELGFTENLAHITIRDDGNGFSFHGRYDLDQLSAMKRGPVTLRERIAALQGTLIIDSKETGASLEISLPLTGFGG